MRFSSLPRLFSLLLSIVLAAAAFSIPAGASNRRGQTGPGLGDSGSGEPAWTIPTPPDTGGRKFSDVGSAWSFASNAIKYVGIDHGWMRDYGTSKFRPGLTESRKYFARAMVDAYGGSVKPDPNITFSDLPKTDPFFDDANIAVSQGWMSRSSSDQFMPDDPVNIYSVYQGLVRSLPLTQEENQLSNLQTTDGYKFNVPPKFATTELGMRLGLRYNHTSEAKDLDPSDPMPRAEVAYALWRRATVPSYTVQGLSIYKSIELPHLSDSMKKVVQFGMDYIGYPYVWGGDWASKTKAGYCCGAQPIGGFDCSGLMWWAAKSPSGGYDNVKVRGYKGWSLPARVASDMASVGKRIKFNHAGPGDLMFYDGGSGTIDHVDMYLGKGWALDSSSGVGGVTILQVSKGWYHDHFVHGRRFVP